MAERHQVRCINKSDRPSAHERIKNIGGVNNDNTRWSLRLDRAIAGIESGKWQLYVVGADGKSVDVVIATNEGRKYLKTANDGVTPNNLLSLPECP